MFASLTTKIVNFLIKNDVIKKDDQEIYIYGFDRILTTLLNIVTVVLLGAILGELYQGLIFVFAFMALRTYSGGYHANTPIQCYALTTLAILAALLVMKFIFINRFICLGLMVLSSLVILLFSPIETANKPLDRIERIVYRRKTIIVWCTETCVALVFLILDCGQLYMPLVLAQILICFALILGKMRNS